MYVNNNILEVSFTCGWVKYWTNFGQRLLSLFGASLHSFGW